MNAFFQFIARHRLFASILFLMIFPFFMPYEALAINILIFGLFAMGFNLLFGYMGLLSFGHAAFLGIGSYLTGISIVHYSLPWGTAILIGVIGAAIGGLIMGFLAIRTRGIYFSMVTLALGQIVYYIFYKAESFTGGENGLRGVKVETFNILGIPVDFLNHLTKYYIILFFVSIALWLISRILNSPLGAVMEAIRENEKRAAACGFDVTKTKLLVFVANLRKHPTPLLLIRAAAEEGILCATDPVTVIVVPDCVAVQVPAPKKGASSPFTVLMGGLNLPPAILLISFMTLTPPSRHC